MGRGGDGLVVLDGKRVFVPGAFVTEKVRVALESRGRARLREVLEPHPSRRAPPCPIADRCGGCPWMALEPEGQRALLQQWGDAMATRLGLAGPVPLLVGTPLEYRRRARLGWRGRTMGYHSARSRKLVDAPDCLVLQPELRDAWMATRTLAPHLGGSGEIRLYRHGDGAVALLDSDAAQPPELYRAAEALVTTGALAGVGLRLEGMEPAVFGTIEERYRGPDGQPLVGPPGGFSQAHDPLSDQLARDVRAAVGAPKHVLELYAGHGSLTVLLAATGARLSAVEVDPAACESLRQNLRERGRKAKVVNADARVHPERFDPSIDVVVLDPPRTGAREPLERLVQGRARPRVVYVSCDLPTLERDLHALREAGYALESLRLYDLFPQTGRVEALAVAVPPTRA